MNILKICFVNGVLLVYSISLVYWIFSPKGLINEGYRNYKNIAYIKKEYKMLDKKTKYLEYLINSYRSNNKDIKNFLFFLKFNKIVHNYEQK
jgi:hypothetical protein